LKFQTKIRERRVIKMNEKKFMFEDALKRLEEINQLLSGGNTTLDEGISLYEEGAKLAAQCKEALESAKERVSKLEQTFEK